MIDIYYKIRTMTVAFQRMFRILERWNNNQVTPSLSQSHELSYRSNIFSKLIEQSNSHIWYIFISECQRRSQGTELCFSRLPAEEA